MSFTEKIMEALGLHEHEKSNNKVKTQPVSKKTYETKEKSRQEPPQDVLTPESLYQLRMSQS